MTRSSPLESVHKSLGAKLTEFGGWNMPLQYSGVIAEHTAVREGVAVFDVSHLGKLVVEGAEAGSRLEAWLPGKVASLETWQAGYNLVLNDSCGIIDDIFVYRHPDFFLLVPNASNTDAVLEEARRRVGPGVRDTRQQWAILAVSGPLARQVTEQLVPEAARLKLHRFREFEASGTDVMIARTGYTGEVTFEFLVPWKDADALWETIFAAGASMGIVPAGLGARDTLRLEMGYPLHGHEISEDTNPIEAGLDWVIDWKKGEFHSRSHLEDLKAQPLTRKLVGFLAHGREIPRMGHSVVFEGSKVGTLTSGNFSPVLGRGIAMGYVPPSHSAEGTMLTVDVRSKNLPVEVVKPPFVTKSK